MYNRFHPTSAKTDLVKRTDPKEYLNYSTLVTQPTNNPSQSMQDQQYNAYMSTTHQGKHVSIPTFTSNTCNNQYSISVDTNKVFTQFHTPSEDCIASTTPSIYQLEDEQPYNPKNYVKSNEISQNMLCCMVSSNPKQAQTEDPKEEYFDDEVDQDETETSVGISWYSNYLDLIEFKKRFGHCNVPQTYLEKKKLGIWVKNQRTDYTQMCKGNKHFLTKARIDLLEKLGFDWSPGRRSHDRWMQQYELLLEFKKRNGHCNVSRISKANKKLGAWIMTQRRFHKQMLEGRRNYLTIERIELLEKIGFEWRFRSISHSR